MASVTLYQRHGLSRLRLRPPRGSVRSAAVLERRGGYLLVTHDQKVDPMTFIGGRYRQLFEVNLTPLQVTYERYVLPSSELARSFLVNLELSVEVEDALKVVQEQKTDPWEAIEPLLEEAREQHLRNLEDQRRVLYEQVVGEGVIPKLLLIKLGARPAGGDPKEIDEVIELMKQVKVDDFKVPLELLASYTHVMERWQLEEPVTTLLRRLVTTFEPQIAPPPKTIDQVEGSSTEPSPPDGDPTIP